MRTFWLHPISRTVGTVISLIAQRFISFNSSSQDGGESKPRNHRLASETQGLQWFATPRSTDGSKKWWTDWCFLFFQNGWYQIRWHHMTRIHNNLKIEFGDFVNISALLVYACLQGTLSIVFGQGWRGSLFSGPELGFFRVDVWIDATAMVPRGQRPKLQPCVRAWDLSACHPWNAGSKHVEANHASVVIWNSWYCWWFRNRKQPPGMYEALVNNGIKLLQSIG